MEGETREKISTELNAGPDDVAFEETSLRTRSGLEGAFGPISTPQASTRRVRIGSDLFLIGYPAELEDFPQPTITRGILSRLREWESIGITYLQTDASIAGGQSGGVLVSQHGEVVGISGFAFSEA